MSYASHTQIIRKSYTIFWRLSLLLLLLLTASHLVGSWVRSLDLSAEVVARLSAGMWLSAVLYALLLAIPFVPGVEIGIGLLGMFGRDVALIVYVATVSGLTLAYAAGRLLPLGILHRTAAALGMRRLAATLRKVKGLPHDKRLELLTNRALSGWGPWLLRNRYLTLAVLLNIPGNAVIGGGGGIALIAGLSRLFSPALFLVCISLAVAPVPLAVAVFGGSVLPAP